MDELTGGRGTIFATGTPISNSMTELYTMQRYLQYDTLVSKNLTHFDAWASIFGETATSIELAPEGAGYRARTRFAKFHNLPEVMCGERDTAAYLQKALGYACTGLMDYECFFVLYGQSSRNGKTTLTESVGTVLGDYCVTAQPQTFSRRNSDGSSASPDTARLKGARLINVSEPEKEMTLNSALIKQLTGGDKYAGRYLNENIFEFRMEGKPFINTNHLPRVSDDTVFANGRASLVKRVYGVKPKSGRLRKNQTCGVTGLIPFSAGRFYLLWNYKT
jgi:putative DNA primase/helicase